MSRFHRKKTPRGSNRIVINSPGAIEHIMNHCPDRIREVAFSVPRNKIKTRLESIYYGARSNSIPVAFGVNDVGEEMIQAVIGTYHYNDFEDIREAGRGEKPSIVLALDHVQDIQNFGAICRTAEVFGADGVVIPAKRSVSVSAGAYHSSVGAVETVPIARVSNLSTSLRQLKEDGYWIVGATLSAESTNPWEIPAFDKVVLVMGSEYEGLSPHIEELCDWKAKIELKGLAGSLNVSVATAILLYEMARRNSLPSKKSGTPMPRGHA